MTGKYLNSTEVYRSYCRRDAIFRLVASNTRLDAPVIAIEVAHTSIECSIECIHDSLCNSFNYNVKIKKCEKLSGNRATVGASKLVASNSWEYYEPEEIQVITLLLSFQKTLFICFYLPSGIKLFFRVNTISISSHVPNPL